MKPAPCLARPRQERVRLAVLLTLSEVAALEGILDAMTVRARETHPNAARFTAASYLGACIRRSADDFGVALSTSAAPSAKE